LKRDNIYPILSILLFAGYLWIGISFASGQDLPDDAGGLCLVKHITGIPCPSCGSTRSIMALINGNIREAAFLNPFGFIIALIMLITPFWIAYDTLSKRKTLFNCYCRSEIFLRKPFVAVPLVALVVINWVWNFYKGV
jgi:hypothetical protein